MRPEGGEEREGKSSFVDAIEYVINDCKIGHQIHEYSGRSQERAIPNTHRPPNAKTDILISFANEEELHVKFKANETSSCSGAETVGMQNWDYQCTVLRQDEVARFIHSSKGEKYSSLLPLLGLRGLEVAAENVRQLVKAIDQQSGIQTLRATTSQTALRKKEVFGEQAIEDIDRRVDELHKRYCPDRTETTTCGPRCDELGVALTARINQLTAEERCHLTLRSIAETDVDQSVLTVREQNTKLAGSVDPLISEKVEILEAAEKFGAKVAEDNEITCPACGQSIPAANFREHVEREKQHLADIVKSVADRRAAMGVLVDNLRDLKLNIAKSEVKVWRDQLKEGPDGRGIAWLESVQLEPLRAAITEETLQAIERDVVPIKAKADQASQTVPPEMQDLASDKTVAETAKSVFAAQSTEREIGQIEGLSAFLAALETGIRAEIRAQSQAILKEITEDVKTMWRILHPGELIDDISLQLPENDKAIDIALKFHGKKQDSPRLTLSEGYRNGLGLCIFLALARRETARSNPLFLDDVVVSLDREHRGMVVQILEQLFADRQVVVLTHDRVWYSELRQLLKDQKRWGWKVLLPYQTPLVGIRIVDKATTFASARSKIQDSPASAANEARTVMDIELGLLAEALQIRMPYVRGEKNDQRMAHDFLERFSSDGKKCFKIKEGGGYVPYERAIGLFEAADTRLIIWGNRGSHSYDVTPTEAANLIEACEAAYDAFFCKGCNKRVSFAKTGDDIHQCSCGQLQWRSGKG